MPDSMETQDKRSELGKALCDAVQGITPENEEERWSYIDQNIGGITPDDFQWLETKGLFDKKNPHMRDLAATAMADTRYTPSTTGLERLRQMTTILEEHPAAKFRAAVALYTRNSPSATVMDVLQNTQKTGDETMKKVVEELFEKFPFPQGLPK